MMNKEQFEDLTEKLNTLIRLVAGNLLKDATNKTQKVEILNNLGVSTKEIAQLLGISNQSVATLKSRLRKRAARKGGKTSGKNWGGGL